jgi:formiminotetrahydrofolate cyclodeaminase
MAAYGLPRETDEEKAARSAAIQTGSKKATLVPLAAARACAEVIDLCQPAADLGNPNVVSDAWVAVLAAQAGLRSAALNVLINLGAIKDEAFVSQHRAELDETLSGHTRLAEEVYELVKGKL